MSKPINHRPKFWFLSLILVICFNGAWTTNEFGYKPSLGARGSTEKGYFDSGLDRIDTRLGKVIWVGDPKYGTTVQAAITAIGTTNPTTLRVPVGTWAVGADLTIPSNITLKPERGAIFAIATSKTLTINGGLKANLYQIFTCTGTGKVVFGTGAVKEVFSEWWGAKGDNVADSAAANTAAINAALNTGMAVRLANGTYYVTSVIVPGYSDLRGQGRLRTYIKGTSAGTVVKSATVDTPGTTLGIKISDLTVDGNNVASGVEIGTDSDSYLTSETYLNNIRVVNVINGIILHHLVYCSFKDILVLGSDTAASYGIKVDRSSGDTLFDNVIAAGFAYNWAVIESAIHTVRCTYYSNSADANVLNLMYLQNAHHSVFDGMTFEHIATPTIDEVLIVGLTNALTIYAQANVFRNCRWVGTNTTSTHLTVGATGGINQIVYSTILDKCSFRASTYGTDIKFVNSSFNKIDRCLRILGYTGVNHFNPLIIPGPGPSRAEVIPINNTNSGTTIVGTFHPGMIINFYTPNDFKGWICTTKGTYSSPAYSDVTGDTDGSTAVITGMTSTSNIYVGEFVKVNAGFPFATVPYQVIAKTATSLTLDTNSTSAQVNVTVTNCLPLWTVIGNLKQTLAFNASYTVDLSLGNHVRTSDIGTASAVTVNAPLNYVAGQEFFLDWTKTTNNLTITWNAIFKASTYTTMTANKRVVIKFIWDGSNWVLTNTPTELTP